MWPTLQLGPLVIPTGGLVLILGVWLALSVVERAAIRLELDVPATYGVAMVTLIAGFVGARLVFVLLHWEAYLQNPLGILWPLTSGFDFWGGLLIGGLAGMYYGRWKRLPLAATLDALVPGLLVALISVSLADFLAGPGYGDETQLPWSVNLFGVRRHPVQLYEMLVGGIALLAWRVAVRRGPRHGDPFLVAVAAYCAGRLLVDAFRADSPLVAGGYHLVQIASLAIMIIALALLARQPAVGEEPLDGVDAGGVVAPDIGADD